MIFQRVCTSIKRQTQEGIIYISQQVDQDISPIYFGFRRDTEDTCARQYTHMYPHIYPRRANYARTCIHAVIAVTYIHADDIIFFFGVCNIVYKYIDRNFSTL